MFDFFLFGKIILNKLLFFTYMLNWLPSTKMNEKKKIYYAKFMNKVNISIYIHLFILKKLC